MKYRFNNRLKLIIIVAIVSINQSYTGESNLIRPFCGFNSLGFYNNNDDIEFDAVKANRGDDSGIPDVVSEIMEKLNVDVEIDVYIVKNQDNCFATIMEGGKRILIVDHNFLTHVNKEVGTDWASISIIAHEVGHHISGFSRYQDSLEAELDADYWSGFILQKFGASEDEAIKCMLKYGSTVGTDSHPNKKDRVANIKRGYFDGTNNMMDTKRCESCEE